ncbi:MAG: tyrosine--tRNA ligase [Bacteroidetes bacterium CG12_big_fil_rev_8_21_14_0_65_60_17]|nr:MAG: tyrosine--tRNA ligase [Bacteroidetes bacterium CG12_big_fil_rev_8_21_14_0_65_60_17]
MSNTIFEELSWRGLIYDATPGFEDWTASGSRTAYIGFDPTASSLHVGSLLPIMGLARMQRFGHRPIALVGGGTGLIGDPSGKSAERQMLTADAVEENLEGIKRQLEPFLDFGSGSNRAVMVNNLDWLGAMGLVDFLRDVGKHFTVNYMLAKESVKRRVQSEEGISYTEFTYMMLQAYDFLELNSLYDCDIQMGGSDQWGNIMAGIDLVRKVRGSKVHGLVFPLVTNASGTKFGKTESGTVWLDPERTSPYRFYQFWLNTDDRDVVPYLKYFTWLSEDDISGLAVAHEAHPGRREAHRALAREVTALVHGESERDQAETAASVLFGGALDQVRVKDLRDIFDDVPSTSLPNDVFSGDGLGILELCEHTGLTASRGEARRLVRAGGLFVNNERIGDEQATVGASHLIEGKLLVLRKGKKSYHLVQIEA